MGVWGTVTLKMCKLQNSKAITGTKKLKSGFQIHGQSQDITTVEALAK
jgi:hypothetical protein